MHIPHFKTYARQQVLSLTNQRRFETKLGERLEVLADKDVAAAIPNLKAKYVLLGIPEDIGVLANMGQAGTSTAWLSFLEAFLNIQSNDFLSGDEIALAGYFDFDDLKFVIDKNATTHEERIDAYRHAVNTIDAEVEGLIKHIVAAGKFPIVIGGGHNNAYPLLKGAAKGLYQLQKVPLTQINCINLDAHSDYRPAEGRHSGNAFRYAEDDGFLQKYFVVGLHENYLPQNIWDDLVNNPFMDCITFEDIFVHEKRTFQQAVMDGIGFTDDSFCGIELDLDAVEQTLSSAITPSGISTIQARQYVDLCATHANACYLHICEGAARMANSIQEDHTGKLISYLVTDFIKMSGERE
ncbi:formimidoylglutamase [Paraflavisolibacter sp. H34]|uniref:formimidoylglutamase n=1 Tax=Huijunlia imazamoxiresistens TaxID=3127457 RepID=UPI003016685B